jgi:hypothetical protein
MMKKIEQQLENENFKLGELNKIIVNTEKRRELIDKKFYFFLFLIKTGSFLILLLFLGVFLIPLFFLVSQSNKHIEDDHRSRF